MNVTRNKLYTLIHNFSCVGSLLSSGHNVKIRCWCTKVVHIKARREKTCYKSLRKEGTRPTRRTTTPARLCSCKTVPRRNPSHIVDSGVHATQRGIVIGIGCRCLTSIIILYFQGRGLLDS